MERGVILTDSTGTEREAEKLNRVKKVQEIRRRLKSCEYVW